MIKGIYETLVKSTDKLDSPMLMIATDGKSVCVVANDKMRDKSVQQLDAISWSVVSSLIVNLTGCPIIEKE